MTNDNNEVGWMVLGFIEEPSAPKGIPVLAPDLDSALLAAAASEEGFHPVGAMNEAELEQHLRAIRSHREDVNAKTGQQ